MKIQKQSNKNNCIDNHKQILTIRMENIALFKTSETENNDQENNDINYALGDQK